MNTKTIHQYLTAIILCGITSRIFALPPNPWSQLATQDLNAIHKAIEDNDPAMQGYSTQEFDHWYKPGFFQTLSKAKQVSSYGGYWAVLRYYVNGFHCEHLSLQPLLNQNYFQWPGFIIAIRDNAYQVVYQENNNNNKLPPLGAKLLTCDHQSPDYWMKKNVLPYYGDEKIKSSWTALVPYLFRDENNPWYIRPRICLFQEQDQIKTYQLIWQTISSTQFNKTASALAFGPKPDFAIHTFGENSVWISIPTFQPGTIDVNNDIKNSLVNIADNVGKFREKNIIVFDLRSNGGGNATYSRAILQFRQ